MQGVTWDVTSQAVSGFVVHRLWTTVVSGERAPPQPNAWCVAGGTVVIPPISRTLNVEQVGDGTARPPLICGAGDPTVGGECDLTEG